MKLPPSIAFTSLLAATPLRWRVAFPGVLFAALFLPTASADISWASGQFEDDRVLQTVGAPSNVVYAVSLGGGALTTANGYAFQAGAGNPNVSFVSTTASGYLSGGGTTGDANFYQILNTGAVASSSNRFPEHHRADLSVQSQHQRLAGQLSVREAREPDHAG